MKCWYLIDTTCDRPPGICEGCQKYEDWRKESERMTELKPCPFCNGHVEMRDVIDGHDETFAFHCSSCHIHFTKFDWVARDRKDVIEEWNRRVKE